MKLRLSEINLLMRGLDCLPPSVETSALYLKYKATIAACPSGVLHRFLSRPEKLWFVSEHVTGNMLYTLRLIPDNMRCLFMFESLQIAEEWWLFIGQNFPGECASLRRSNHSVRFKNNAYFQLGAWVTADGRNHKQFEGLEWDYAVVAVDESRD